MTEDLLQKLEEKMMALFSELEDARKEVTRLASENAFLKAEKESHSKKLHDLLSLLDAIHAQDVSPTPSASVQTMKPMLVQG